MLRSLTAFALLLCLDAAGAAAQTGHTPGDSAAMIDAKRMEIRHHTERIQGITNTAELQREMQKHFGMVEELMSLMIAQQRQALGSAASPQPAMSMEGEMAMPMPAGQSGTMGDDDAMEMPMAAPADPAGGSAMPGGAGGMMDDDAMEMPTAPSGGMGGGSMGGMMGGMHGEHGTGQGMGGAGMAAAPDAARRLAEREALLAEVTRHSQYIESLQDPAIRSREILRHQQMLDRLLELMR